MVAAGASPKRWAVHALVGVLGVAAYGIALAPRRTLPLGAQLGVAGAAGLVIASTLLGDGIDAVRRWHDFGVLLIHPSALLVPSLLMLAAALLSSRRAPRPSSPRPSVNFPCRSWATALPLSSARFGAWPAWPA